MASDFFRFKRFTIYQDRCAMKVGTDGTLLGAWACGGKRILDIGTGTGLVALMMAQRFPEARVTAVDIDDAAVEQAARNVAESVFAHQVVVLRADVRSFVTDSRFDTIVSNPPYYDNSLACPDEKRTLARHTASLSYAELIRAAHQLLTEDGVLSVVIPTECRAKMEAEATLAGFFKVRECAVKTTPRKNPRRYLLAFAKHSVPMPLIEEEILEMRSGQRSDWYVRLTKDFYL